MVGPRPAAVGVCRLAEDKDETIKQLQYFKKFEKLY
jgi:hypothetical protein